MTSALEGLERTGPGEVYETRLDGWRAAGRRMDATGLGRGEGGQMSSRDQVRASSGRVCAVLRCGVLGPPFGGVVVVVVVLLCPGPFALVDRMENKNSRQRATEEGGEFGPGGRTGE